MKIEELTIGEAKTALFCAKDATRIHPATGKYVIVRCYSAGVHAGVLHESANGEATLTRSRRIWSWSGALSCSEIAMSGVTGGKIAVEVPTQFLTGVIEIIPASEDSQKCLQSMK